MLHLLVIELCTKSTEDGVVAPTVQVESVPFVPGAFHLYFYCIYMYYHV